MKSQSLFSGKNMKILSIFHLLNCEKLHLLILFNQQAGPSCSKLMMLLVNVSLKL